MRRLSVLCLGLALVAGAGGASARDGYPLPAAGQGRDAYRDAASDAYEGEGRLQAMRALSAGIGDLQETLVNGLRMRGLLRLHAKAGVDADEARRWLVERGMPAGRADAAVASLMRADANGDGRVTLAEFEGAQGGQAQGMIAAVRGAIGASPENRQGWEDRAAGAFDAADKDGDGRISAGEALDYAKGLGRR